jgi:hypothetical protein
VTQHAYCKRQRGSYAIATAANACLDNYYTTSSRMISEVLNALFLTYIVTEYLLASNLDHMSRDVDWSKRILQRHNIIAALILAMINVLERITGAADIAKDLFQGFIHAPKIVFAAICYIFALRVDCRKVAPHLGWKAFLYKVLIAFLYVLPVYPALAVLISFGFLIVINIFEVLHLNEDILNWPIYYGTLYGPFSFVYWKVKGDILEERTTLPSSTSQGRRLGRE